MLIILIKVILLPLLAPLCVGVIRRVKAFMQNRTGASVIQPYVDLWKLFHKDEVVSRDASWIFLITPFLRFAISIFGLLAVPVFGSADSAFPMGDFLLVIFSLSLGTFFLALAGIDVGGAFGGFGSSREMTLAALAEAVLIFTILPVALLTNTTQLAMMAMLATNLPMISYFTLRFAFLGYIIAFFAETG